MKPPSSKRSELYQDSARSWLVAVACGWCLFWTLIINRCGGIVFVTIVTEMGASREAASWPFSLLGAVINLSGVASGVLLKKLPLRSVSLAGSLLTAAGALLCTVFYDLVGITVCLGVISAIGQGLVFPSNAIAINTYFKKFRASGSGISYAGGSLIAFVFPSVVVYLNDKYGLRGTFLVVGGLTLNAVAGSLLIRSPEDLIRESQSSAERHKLLEQIELEGVRDCLQDCKGCGTQGQNDSEGKANERCLGHQRLDATAEEQGDGSARVKKQAPFWSVLFKELSFLKRPINYVITLTGVVFTSVSILYNVTLADHAIGQGLAKWEAALLFSCSGAGDVVGRLVSGQLSDRKLCHRRDVMAIGFLIMASSLVGLMYANSLALLGLVTVVFGLASGSLIILFSVITVEYLGLEALPLAFSFQSLVCGLVALPRPLLIGYYRDRRKSYAGLYTLLGTACFVIGLVWSAECFLQWRAAKRLRKEKSASREVSA
ncbi:hypothetical protein HPB48_006558 [Haemaphysalis longicornis]|uniref:Major facilitator superfamily (MFS) profile domain-containing protein n=1 Tax=Haemaphysalis longicornis TaxID=44386 RepID=A0A9J6GNV6_HAELO|nr:hypothetical protein HPB48_006558 [Haemaphysalis longicornis]